MKYFTYSEFDSPDKPGSGRLMNTTFLLMLEKARSMAKVPFVITSGYRTPEHNRIVGGVPGSAHTKGLAADIAVTPNTYGIILKALIKAGFRRIGLGKDFIHVDIDTSKPYPAVWAYSNSPYHRLATKLTSTFRQGGQKKNGLFLAATVTGVLAFITYKHLHG